MKSSAFSDVQSLAEVVPYITKQPLIECSTPCNNCCLEHELKA